MTSMKRAQNRILYFLMVICLMVGLCPQIVYASDAKVYFGSQSYKASKEEGFKIGVYLESDETIGEYTLQFQYDTKLLKYKDGGTTGGDGVVTISGNLQGKKIQHMLRFDVIGAGDITVSVISATVKTGDQTTEMQIQSLPKAPVKLSGEFEEEETEAGEETETVDEELEESEETEGHLNEAVDTVDAETEDDEVIDEAIDEALVESDELSNQDNASDEVDSNSGMNIYEEPTKQLNEDSIHEIFIVSIVVLGIVFFIILIRIIIVLRNRSREKRAYLEEKEEENSDFKFDSLYDQ